MERYPSNDLFTLLPGMKGKLWVKDVSGKMTQEEKEGLEKLRDRVRKAQRLTYPTSNKDCWWGILVYTIIDGLTYINSYDLGCLLANCSDGSPWWTPKEISEMPINTLEDQERDNTFLDDNFNGLTIEFNRIRKEGMSDVKWLKDHPYYTQKKEVIAPVLKKDASEGDKLMAFFFAPKEEKRPENSPYEFL